MPVKPNRKNTIDKTVMKINYFIIILLAVLSMSCSNKTVILTEGNLPEDIFYLQDEIKPFSGKCYIYFHNSELIKEELNFKDGILHGLRVSYFKNGQIKRQGFYNIGKYNGTWKGFNELGSQIFEAEYNKDTLNGQFISWYRFGVIKEKGSYNKNARVGAWILYDEAGMILKQTIL